MTTAALDVPRRERSVAFFPRLGALILDFMIVVVAVQLLATALHHLSLGAVQGAAGLAFVGCEPLPSRPALNPPPPDDYNFTFQCKRSLFGLDMANWLAVGKVVRVGDTFDKEQLLYAMGPRFEQAPTSRPMIFGDGWVIFFFLLYKPLGDWLFGRTFGKKLMRLRTVAIDEAQRYRLPFGRAIVRTLGLYAGLLVPTLVVAAYVAISGDIDGATTLTRWLYMVIAGWFLLNVGLLMTGTDTLYDRLAGTTVLRT